VHGVCNPAPAAAHKHGMPCGSGEQSHSSRSCCCAAVQRRSSCLAWDEEPRDGRTHGGRACTQTARAKFGAGRWQPHKGGAGRWQPHEGQQGHTGCPTKANLNYACAVQQQLPAVTCPCYCSGDERQRFSIQTVADRFPQRWRSRVDPCSLPGPTTGRSLDHRTHWRVAVKSPTREVYAAKKKAFFVTRRA
jgi:hypothetical protein